MKDNTDPALWDLTEIEKFYRRLSRLLETAPYLPKVSMSFGESCLLSEMKYAQSDIAHYIVEQYDPRTMCDARSLAARHSVLGHVALGHILRKARPDDDGWELDELVRVVSLPTVLRAPVATPEQFAEWVLAQYAERCSLDLMKDHRRYVEQRRRSKVLLHASTSSHSG